MSSSTSRRVRLSIDVAPQERRRLNVAAARRDQSIRDYVWEAIEARLLLDGVDDHAAGHMVALTEESDTVLARVWDNPADAAYDDL